MHANALEGTTHEYFWFIKDLVLFDQIQWGIASNWMGEILTRIHDELKWYFVANETLNYL